MNIHSNLNGTCCRVCPIDESLYLKGSKKDARYCLQVEIPITFTEISSVDQGILQAGVQNASIGGERQIQTLTKVQILPYSRDLSQRVPIQDRPVLFRNMDGNDSNSLLFSFHLIPKDITDVNDHLSGHELYNNKIIELTLSISLINSTKLHLVILIKPQIASGVLKILSIKKKNHSKVTTANILLTSFLVILIMFWWMYVNQNLYMKVSILDKIQAFVFGSLITFLGLSMTYIRSWYKTLANFTGFLKYPEFHLPLNTLNAFKSKISFALITISLGVSIFFLFNEWSIYLPKLPNKDFIIYDSQEKTILPNDKKRIYLNHLANKGRYYALLNGIQDIAYINSHYYVGKIQPGKGLQRFFSTEYMDIPKTITNPPNDPIAFEISKIENTNLNRTMQKTIKSLYQGKSIEGYTIQGNAILLEKSKEISVKDLKTDSQIISAKIFKDVTGEELYKNRHTLYETILNEYKNREDYKLSVIKGDTLIVITHALIDQIFSWGRNHITEKETRLFILLRGLWEVASELNSTPNKDQISEVAQKVNKRVQDVVFSSTPNKAMASAWEFLLKIENTYQEACGLTIHKATIGDLNTVEKSWIDDQGREAKARLLRTCLKMGSLEGDKKGCEARRQFFNAFLVDLPKTLKQGVTISIYFKNYYREINEKLSIQEIRTMQKLFGIVL